MIQVVNLSKAYGDQVLFENVSFSLTAGEKIGLVGRNGHGKTTLFRMILGQEEPTQGEIVVPADYKIGHLSQHISFGSATILQEACAGLTAQDEHYTETYMAEAILQGLGFNRTDFARSPQEISGGYQIRLNLARVLVAEPNLLLLDEPTNYLDIVSLRWLRRFLRDWKRELMIITHDREFMDEVITHTLGIHRSGVRKIAGGTRRYYAQIEQDEELYERTRLNQEKKVEQAEAFIKRFRAKATKASVVQSRIKALNRMETLEALDEIEVLDFKFASAPFPGKQILEAKALSFGYDPGALLFKDVSFEVGRRDRIAVIGKNGKGKTTLLKVLADELAPSAGALSCSPNMQLGYFGQTNVERLIVSNTIEQEVLAVVPDYNRTLARTLCGLMMFSGDMALKKISVLSGGEKSRVLLAKILATPANLLLLDEPANHLDMYSTEALIKALERFDGAVMVVTHSEEMLHRVANRLIVFDRGGASVFNGTYQEFLERVGWQDEGGAAPQAAAKESVGKKDDRRQRAEALARRGKVLNPIKQRVAAIEQSIVNLEASVAAETEQLIEVTKGGFGDDAAKLSRSVKRNQAMIEELFEKLEAASRELDEKVKEFE